MRTVVAILASMALVACSQPAAKTGKKYPLTGKIVSIDLKQHTAEIDAAAIPNYMDAMKMDYPVASDADLASLKVGEQINATVNVDDDGSYQLSNIHEIAK